jgi:hypothetical protein
LYTAGMGTFTGAGAAVSADLVQTMDVGLNVASHPSMIATGGGSAFVFSISDQGPSVGTATFSETVPGGLSVLSAVSGSGACTVTGQLVSCAIGPLAPGSTTPVDITVSALAPGEYVSTATVTPSFADPSQANNSATVALNVSPAPAPAAASCHVVSFKGVSLRETKSLLVALNCAIGKVTKHTSTKIPKGEVISTSPRRGSYPNATKVAITESSGAPKPRHKHRK